MANKYHINPETGRPNICRADKEPCPVGGAHFDNKAEAKAAGEKMMAEKHDTFTTMSKKNTESTDKNDAATVEVDEMDDLSAADLSERDPSPQVLEDPNAVKLTLKERGVFKRSMAYDDDVEVNDDDRETLNEAFLDSIGYETEEVYVKSSNSYSYGSEVVVDMPTGDVKPINKNLLVDNYYRSVSKKNVSPEDAREAKKIIAKVFEKYDMFESYNYSPNVEENEEYDEYEVKSYECFSDTDSMINELKGIFHN